MRPHFCSCSDLSVRAARDPPVRCRRPWCHDHRGPHRACCRKPWCTLDLVDGMDLVRFPVRWSLSRLDVLDNLGREWCTPHRSLRAPWRRHRVPCPRCGFVLSGDTLHDEREEPDRPHDPCDKKHEFG